MDPCDPSGLRKLSALVVGNRDEPRSRKLSNDVGQSRKVQPTMRRREKRHSQPTEQRERQPIYMGVDDVEIGGALGDRFQRKGGGGTRVGALATEPQRPRPYRMKLAHGP